MESQNTITPLQQDISTWRAIDSGRQIVFASFTLIVYEYFITLDQEVKFFWKGRWTPSRMLYLANRYLPPIIMALLIVCFNAPLTLELCVLIPNNTLNLKCSSDIYIFPSCDHSIRAVYGLSTVALFVIQGILVLRVYYLFQHSVIARVIISFTYLSAIIATIILLYVVLHGRSLLTPLSTLAERVHLVGCPVHTMTLFWGLFLPAFGLHTTLYIFTLIRVLTCEDSPQALLIRRLHRDGGYFYLVVIASVGYTEIGAGLSNERAINIPAVFANFLLASTSISISRVMLSFHELAEKIRNDPKPRGFVNSIPLNRIAYTKGAHDGEYLVDGGIAGSVRHV